MRVFSTHYALTKGIEAVEGAVFEPTRGSKPYFDTGNGLIPPQHWYYSKDAARLNANDQRDRRVAALERKADKLRLMVFP